jgi:general secretion pathway protein F
MVMFKYTAQGTDNSIKEGVLDEPDKTAVARSLMLQGLRPLEIKPHKSDRKKQLSLPVLQLGKNKITKADIDFFTRQISLLLSAGLSLDAALRTMRQNSQKEAFKQFTGSLERDLKEGKSFSQALADYPYFSPMYINIAKAGEEGGILPAMLMKISEYQSTFRELKQFIISASIYPLFLLVVGIVAILILITTILPRFEVLFEGMGQQLPAHVSIMMAGAGFISENLIICLLLLAAPIAGIVYYLKTPAGKEKVERVSVKIPGVAGFVQDLETTRIFRTLEVLVKNGVHLATALRICSGIAVNHLYRNLLNRATDALKEGQRVSDKLKGEGLLPPLAVDLLSIGEESGRVGDVCGQIADHFDEELRTRVKRLIALVEPCFILMIALVAGYIVVSMLSVILSINEIAG